MLASGSSLFRGCERSISHPQCCTLVLAELASGGGASTAETNSTRHCACCLALFAQVGVSRCVERTGHAVTAS